ncbi:MAG TPA: HNH endonuclease family protein, partial [Sporichthya sp.]|nr:HNH endonuclease family protein [Sporichthya sp.]
MSFVRRLSIGALTATAVAAGMLFVGPAPAEAGVTLHLRKAISILPVAGETRAGYDRDKFGRWTDSDGDCQDTRSEVLRQETRTPVTGSCTVVTGKWVSPYDGAIWTSASDVDIDHLVPLAEAWDSGAKKWNRATRRAFANDLGDPRTLVAVTDNVNSAKGDRDPAHWMPTQKQCTYIAQWVAVKSRWQLSVDRAEKNALTRIAAGCSNSTIKFTRAKVVERTAAPSGSVPAPEPSSGC